MCVPPSRIFGSISLASGVGARRDEQTAPRKQQRPHGGHARYELTTTDGECATASATFSRPWAAPPFASPFAMTFPSTTSSASSSPLVVAPTVTPRMVLRSSSSSPPAPAPSSAPTAAPSADVWASSGVSAAAFGGAGFCRIGRAASRSQSGARDLGGIATCAGPMPSSGLSSHSRGACCSCSDRLQQHRSPTRV